MSHSAEHSNKSELVTALATSVDKFGRPSKLTPQVIQQAWDYITKTTNAGGLLPTKERLALTLKVTRQTLENWADQSADFLDILNTLEIMQADMLLQNGLTNRYNSTITKLLLSKHGYIEKTEVDNKHEMVQPILSNLAKKQVDAIHSNPDDL